MGRLKNLFDLLALPYFKYPKTLESLGPIESLEYRAFTLLTGENLFQFTAKLKNELIPSWVPKASLYSTTTGTGTDKHKRAAMFKAISEALERWAFYHHSEIGDHGFNIDNSTNGIACFPGWNTRRVREIAFCEAFERWAIRAWWARKVSTTPIFLSELSKFNISAFKINLGINLPSVILLQSKAESKIKNYPYYVYGFAADFEIKEGVKRALIEMTRNVEVLSNFYDRTTELKIEDPNEYRLIYFSTDKGNHLFSKAAEKFEYKDISPVLVIDEEIKGPWSNYANVWRCLFNPVFPADIAEDEFFF